MAPVNKKVRTYGNRTLEGSTSKSVEVVNALFVKNLYKKRKKVIKLKDLPSSTHHSALFDKTDSFKLGLDNTFDRLANGTTYNIQAEAEIKEVCEATGYRYSPAYTTHKRPPRNIPTPVYNVDELSNRSVNIELPLAISRSDILKEVIAWSDSPPKFPSHTISPKKLIPYIKLEQLSKSTLNKHLSTKNKFKATSLVTSNDEFEKFHSSIKENSLDNENSNIINETSSNMFELVSSTPKSHNLESPDLNHFKSAYIQLQQMPQNYLPSFSVSLKSHETFENSIDSTSLEINDAPITPFVQVEQLDTATLNKHLIKYEESNETSLENEYEESNQTSLENEYEESNETSLENEYEESNQTSLENESEDSYETSLDIIDDTPDKIYQLISSTPLIVNRFKKLQHESILSPIVDRKTRLRQQKVISRCMSVSDSSDKLQGIVDKSSVFADSTLQRINTMKQLQRPRRACAYTVHKTSDVNSFEEICDSLIEELSGGRGRVSCKKRVPNAKVLLERCPEWSCVIDESKSDCVKVNKFVTIRNSNNRGSNPSKNNNVAGDVRYSTRGASIKRRTGKASTACLNENTNRHIQIGHRKTGRRNILLTFDESESFKFTDEASKISINSSRELTTLQSMHSKRRIGKENTSESSKNKIYDNSASLFSSSGNSKAQFTCIDLSDSSNEEISTNAVVNVGDLKVTLDKLIESTVLEQSDFDDIIQVVLPKKRVTIRPGKCWRRSLAVYKKEQGQYSCYVPDAPRKSCVLEQLLQSLSLIEQDDDDDDVVRDRTQRIQAPPAIVYTAREIVLRRCGQTEPLPFAECYPNALLKNCQKIGEGVYGEVFLFRNTKGTTSVMKIIPIEGMKEVNGEKQKKFEEILSEIIIALELSNLRNNQKNSSNGFNEVCKIHCAQGKYPDRLLELWEMYDENKGSENDCPDVFTDEQLYIILELANGGKDLESYVFNNAMQAYSIFLQTACSLAVAEVALEFEHRDLHWGNILVSTVDERLPNLAYNINGRQFEVPANGVQVSIIDYTLSRVTYDEVCIHNNLGDDLELFTAEGDYQFEIYRLMQKCNGNEWSHFEPYSNVLWLHYTLDKMITALRYKYTKTKRHMNYIDKLKTIKEKILDFKSVEAFVTHHLG